MRASLVVSHTGVKTLAPLARLTELREVALEGTAVGDLGPLRASAANLRRLAVSPRLSTAALTALNPDIEIDVAETPPP